jgi:hypothetical protein
MIPLIIEPINNFDRFIVLWLITWLLLFCSLISDSILDTTFCKGYHEIAWEFLSEVLFVYLLNLFPDTGIVDWDQESNVNLSLGSFTDQVRGIENDWF